MSPLSRFPLRLSIPLLLLVIALTVELFSTTYSRIQADQEEERESLTLVAQDMSVLKISVLQRLRLGDWPGVQQTLAAWSTHPNIINLSLVDERGIVAASTNIRTVGLPASRGIPGLDPAVMKEAAATSAGKTLFSSDRRVIITYHPVFEDPRPGELRARRAGMLVMRYDAGRRKEVRRQALRQQAFAEAILFGWLLLMLGALLHVALTRRVALLVNVAKRLTEGDLTARCRLKGADELAELGKAFDRMADEISISNELAKAAADKYRIVADNTYDWEFWIAPAGEFLYISPSCHRITGFQAADFREDPGLFSRIVYRDDLEVFRSHRKEAVEGNPCEIRYRIVRADGEIRWLDHTCQPVVDSEGRFLGTRGSNRDITERMKGEEARAHLAAIVEFTDDAAVGKTLEGNIVSWNRGAEHLYGYRRDEVLGRSISLLVPPERAEEIKNVLQQVAKGTPVERHETVRVCKDGRRVDVAVTVSPIFDTRGEVVGAASIARDITPTKKAEAELRKLYAELENRVRERTAELDRRGSELAQSQRALMNLVDDLNQKTEELEQANIKLKDLDRLKSMFIATMSHELRTPLNSIIGFSSIILHGWTGPVTKEQSENLEIILRSGKHLLNLINDVIDVSKIEAGKIEAVLEEFELFDLVVEAVKLVKKDYDEKGLLLRVEAGRAPLHTDRRRLLQALINLLSNAQKFTAEGEVTVATRLFDEQGRGMVEISVTDTGMGIAEDDLPRMFQAFVRLGHPSGSPPGTGLGLYLTHKLVSGVLEGEVTVESVLGKGSRFGIVVPARLGDAGGEPEYPGEGEA
ncbi:PAS domain S-box protein [Geomonas sp. Red32]|uniref:PAS domain S-box protein n=1 Tax=Geomonas sp. Red32 TaxID=2912856 RepID=UPI00202CBA00|nr:PAS domain S-box protein [Geomonas sp. Red32]